MVFNANVNTISVISWRSVLLMEETGVPEVRIPLRLGALDTTLCDKVCQWLATCRWFSPGTPVSSTNKTDRQDITEILLKVALNTITLTISINIRFVYLVNLGVYIFDDAVYFSVCLFSFIVKLENYLFNSKHLMLEYELNMFCLKVN